MHSLLAALGSREFLCRTAIAVTILVVTIAVSIIWQKMVYTIPVLAVLLFLAAGIKLGNGSTRNIDQETTDLDVDAGMDGG